MLEQYYDKNGWDKYIQPEELQNAEIYIDNIKNIKYVGHGGTCIAFVDDNNNEPLVIKVCLKDRMVVNDSKMFVAFSKCLQGNGIKILPIIDILFEDKNLFIYSQNYCQTIIDINSLVLSKILKIIR